MKKTFRKSIAFLLAFVMLLTAFAVSPFSASAAVSTASALDNDSCKLSIWADPNLVLKQEDISSSSSLATLGSVQPTKISTSSSTYYWFFPSNADLSALTLWFNPSTTVTINDVAVTSGEPTNAFASINEGGVTGRFSVKIGSSTYNTTAIKSGTAGTVFIDIDSAAVAENGDDSLVTNFSAINSSSDHSAYAKGTIMIVQPDGTVDYSGVMEKFSGRGNSGSWSTSNTKNPYNFKLGMARSLLGMSEAKKWCLIANATDPSLLKNKITYDFSRYIGVPNQVKCKPVDVYVNQQYIGSYMLTEKPEIKSDRVKLQNNAFSNLELANGELNSETGAILPADLSSTAANGTVKAYTSSGTPTIGTTNTFGSTVGNRKYSPKRPDGANMIEPSDATGGYIYELEITQRWPDENAGFCAYNRQGWTLKSCDVASKGMVDYSYDLLFALGSSVYNNGTVPSTATTTTCKPSYLTVTTNNPAPATQYQGKKWSDLLDADSAVKYYWTQEFFKNLDSSTTSTYFFKDSDSIDSKLYAGPVWDMDNALCYDRTSGERWGYSYVTTNGWYTKNTRIYRFTATDSKTTYSTDAQMHLTFYGALATKCSDFWPMAEKYYYQYITPAVNILLGNAAETGKLKSVATYVQNITKTATMNAVRFDTTYDAASVQSGITNWISERHTWIDSQITKLSINSAYINPVDDIAYTGNPITPQPAVSLSSVTLEKDVDYTLSYQNNIDAGTATVIATGIGKYTGSAKRTFTITSDDISANHTLSIDSSTYKDTQLTAVLTDTNTGAYTENSYTLQWYRNNTAISGATSDTYTVTESDVGTSITCVATGDGSNFTGTLTSNTCTVLAGTRPTGYTRTIASWNYDFSADSTALVNTDTTGTTFSYGATGGELQAAASLSASVNGTDPAEIKWSGDNDFYVNSSQTNASDHAPIMGTSKSDNLAWDYYPYFETTISTLGYDNICFSAKLGGTNKGPKIYMLRYSLDGEEYTDLEDTIYSITTNKTMELAFDNVALPAECSNQRVVYIRMEVYDDVAINGATIMYQLSGDAAVNNIAVTGVSLSAVESLSAPTYNVVNNANILNEDTVAISDTNGGADVFYTVNDGTLLKYTDPFNPFDPKTASIGDTATITAFSQFEDIISDYSTVTLVYGGTNINSFVYTTYSTDVTGGAVQSTGGVYGKSGKMTAYTDGNSQYVPLWRDDNGSFCVAPDDGAVWTNESGFTYQISTAGYENINFSFDAYTTLSGPRSVTVQYSTDGMNFINVQTNIVLDANGQLNAMPTVTLPAECNNLSKLYIRLATTENATNSGATLHNDQSKGNLYVNNVVITGNDNGNYKMPYTNKSTNYFGVTGTIKYVSPDNAPMTYLVTDSNNNIVLSGSVPATGIQLSQARGFDATAQEQYKVVVQAGEDESYSAANIATYMYKGDTVVKFNYNSTTRPFNNYASPDYLSAVNTSGVNSGTIEMYPDATTNAALNYTGTYGVKVSATTDKRFAATKNLDNPSGNGYWLITTSTTGFENLTLNLEQLSSEKAPRDWGVAYSTDGSTYTYVANSNVRAVSNSVFDKTIETYGNLPLPAECNDKETLYIKIFINGGESVDGDELADLAKGNTGINNIELSGTPQPKIVEISASLPQPTNGTVQNRVIEGAEIYVNGNMFGTTNANGVANIRISALTDATIEVRFANTSSSFTITADDTSSKSATLNIFDYNNDGYVNAKDFGTINKLPEYNSYKQLFKNYIGAVSE